jgi:hypothetical protein
MRVGVGGENARDAGWVFPGEEPATGAPVVAVVVQGVRIAEGERNETTGDAGGARGR